MFNYYSKFVTAFAAFALLFSTAAWSQCDEGLIEVVYTINTGVYPGEVSWTLNDDAGTPVLSGAQGDGPVSSYICLVAGDYTFIGSDSYGDGWDVGSATFSVGGVTVALFTLEAGYSGSLTFTVNADVPGCMDSTASNYNEAATVDNGTCCFDDTIEILLLDSWGDGWTAGGLDIFGQFFEFATGTSLSIVGCIPAGCYSGTLVFDGYPAEASWEVYSNGALIASGTYENSFFFSTDPSCVVWGCSDDVACNYVPGTNQDDGSCEYLTCAGCTDAMACDYDETATLSTECDYSCVGCMDATATNFDVDATMACADCCSYCELTFAVLNMYDSYGDGWNNNSLTVNGVDYCFPDAFGDCTSTNVFTNWSNGISFNLCLDTLSCNIITYNPDGAYQGENSWDIVDAEGNVLASGGPESGTLGTCVLGCNDEVACNYDMTADILDESCDYSCIGCMDAAAANFDPNASVDSGLCVYCDPGTFVLTLDMNDTYGDGWNGAEYYVYDQVSGALVLQGDLDSAFSGDGLSSGADLVCLAPGCYSVQLSSGEAPNEISISMSDQFGTNYGTTTAGTTYPLDFTLTGACAFEGCTSSSALNFNISATIDDGSCQEPPANDQLANAEAVFCGAYASGTLLYSTDDQGLIGTTFANAPVSSSGVWYTFNAAADQQVIVSTCDTPTNDGTTDYTANTKLHVYTMGMDGSLVAISSNDDGCDTGSLSTVIFNVATGSDYYVLVSAYSPSTTGNDFVLSVDCVDCGAAPSNDDCDGAIAQVTGQTFTGSTCCANAEDVSIWTAGTGTAYGVWFTFNSSNYNTFYFDATNVSNGVLGFMMFNGNTCDEVDDFVGCQFTGVCAGDVSAFLDLEPNVEYYFLIYTNDPTTCGDFEFTTTGIILGCTDAEANNFNLEANLDDGTCDFDGIVPANDLCDNAVTLECNAVTTGSTGGATMTGSPLGVADCESAPGAGVWYTFVGDGQLHSLSTCGSAIDSKINIYTATEACGGGSIDVPEADACGEGLVTTNCVIGGGSWDAEISWSLADAAGVVVASGPAGVQSLCLVAGDYTLTMSDAYGDGWNGGSATFTNGLGGVLGYAILEAGAEGFATITIAPYSMEPIYQAGDFTCFASAVVSDGTGVCTLFDDDDVNFEFISEVGTLYYVLVGSQGAAGTFDITFDCATVVEGCMNGAACNYDETANVENDTCDFWTCVCASETGTPIQLNMVDAFGDGWNGAGYTISDLAGNLVYEGGLDDAQFFVDDDNYGGPEYGFDMLCLEPGCYNISVSPGDWASEVSWGISLEDGTIIVSGGAPDTQTISVGGAVCGCTDAAACNYDELATDEDGSCEFVTCAGCTDASSCSYDADATIDDGTCCYSNCVTVQMYDSWGDGWNGGFYTLSSVDGTVIGEGTIENGGNAADSYCLADGCYTIDVVSVAFASEMSWNVVGSFGGLVQGLADESVTFNVGSGDQCVVGCDISCACNYNADVNISDVAQCVFSGCEGCTYPDAANFNDAAISDDGSCTFDIANPCPADLNGDGSITTGDLLIFLGAFGTICE